MLKIGDMVLILDVNCIDHANECCDHDLTKPVKVIAINNRADWITVELPDGDTCRFRSRDLKRVKEGYNV